MKSIQELLDLNGKVAVVTGAGMGIGKGIAHRLAEAGAHVVVADVDVTAADDTARELVADGRLATAIKTDVASEEEITSLIADTVDRFGSLDILVNNAGIYPIVPLAELSADLFDRVMHVNLRSVFLTTKHAAEVMKKQGGGKIINVTSIDALHPSMVGLAHYDASKHGEWGFTRNSALELAPFNITVNAVAPGGIATPGTTGPDLSVPEEFLAKIPMHRMGNPDEVAAVVLFLARGMSSYMTGAQIVVDGGVLLA
ncbi:MAG: short-chain dehydrogenase/reductase [Frankiales bacterium]|nr:short-chain dehydrogenase/reductase [Frankiales bacterium]